MRPVVWSLVATGLAVILFAAGGQASSDTALRGLGAAGGGVAALVGALAGWRARRRGPTVTAAVDSPLASRFFLERRRASRHAVQIPVRFAVDGRSYTATLVNVSAGGALLRLRPEPGETLYAQVGDPVHLEDYPAGTLARIGTHGVYVDFAVRFGPATGPSPERRVVESVAAPRRR
jgi:hypothetical protein